MIYWYISLITFALLFSCTLFVNLYSENIYLSISHIEFSEEAYSWTIHQPFYEHCQTKCIALIVCVFIMYFGLCTIVIPTLLFLFIVISTRIVRNFATIIARE
jgi:hypothetical protein